MSTSSNDLPSAKPGAEPHLSADALAKLARQALELEDKGDIAGAVAGYAAMLKHQVAPSHPVPGPLALKLQQSLFPLKQEAGLASWIESARNRAVDADSRWALLAAHLRLGHLSGRYDFTSILSLLAAQPEATAGPIKREVLEKSPEACRCALKQDAQDAVALQFMAKHLAAQGKEAEAIEILERCLKASPQQAEARRLLLRVKRHTLDKPALIAERLKAADELMERGEHEAALSELEFVLRLGARSATTLAKIGGCCVALGRLAEGEAHLDAAAALDFACPEARFYRGSLLAKRQRLSEAIAEMEGARDAAVAGSALAEKASALLRETHAAKGRADYFDGHLEAARKHYEESLKGAKEPPPDAVRRLARIDELTGQHGSAAGRWRLAAASGDAEAEWRAEVNALAAQRQPDPLAQAVTLCLSHQRADLAREILDKVGRVKLDRKVRAQINKQLDKLDEPCRKGLADLRADNFGEAASHYKEALRLFPNAQEPLWRLGFVHAEISSWRQSTAKDEELATARKFLTAAVEVDPTSEMAQNARNKLRQIAVA